jgi:hypothetical protein
MIRTTAPAAEAASLPGRRGPLGPAGRAAIAILAVPWAAAPPHAEADQPPLSRPAVFVTPAGPNAPASRPGTETKSVPSYAHRLAEAIRLTPRERVVFDAVRDRIGALDETGLYAMLAVAARAPEPDAIEWDELDAPAYVNLLRDPARYRAAPMKTRLRVYHARKLLSGAGLGFDPHWPATQPVWEMDCVWSDAPNSRDKPLKVFSIVNPDEYLGEPDQEAPDGEKTYEQGPEIRAAALFYKVLTRLERGSKEQGPRAEARDYPVLMAWKITHTTGVWQIGGWGAGSRLGQLLPLIILLIVLLGGFVFMKRRLARARAAPTGPYRPPRRPADRQDARESKGGDRHPEPEGPVDPDLAAAVEDYLHETRGDDAGPHPTRKG